MSPDGFALLNMFWSNGVYFCVMVINCVTFDKVGFINDVFNLLSRNSNVE